MTEKYVLREAAKPVLTDAVYQPAEASVHVAAGDDSNRRPAVHVASGHAAQRPLDGPGIYDRAKVLPLLDSIPSMDAAGRGRADVLLMWMTSLCVLRGTAAHVAFGRWRPAEVGHYSAVVVSASGRTGLTPRLSPRRAARDDTPRGARRAS